MPLITQGKTNWKFLLIVVILAIVVGGGTIWLVKEQGAQFAKLPEIKIPEKVKDETADSKICSLSHPEFCKIDCITDTDCISSPGRGCGCINIGEKCQGECEECLYFLPPYFCKCENNKCEIDETADFYTYRNENGGYEIKYPSDLIIKHTISEAGKTLPDFVDNLEINSQSSSTTPAKWRIEVWKNKDGLTIQQRADQLGIAIPIQNKTITDITIDGVAGKKVILDSLPSDVDPNNAIINGTSIFFVKDGNIYTFYCLNKITQKSGVQDYDYNRFNQMLSTFRFLN